MRTKELRIDMIWNVILYIIITLELHELHYTLWATNFQKYTRGNGPLSDLNRTSELKTRLWIDFSSSVKMLVNIKLIMLLWMSCG